MIAIYRSRDIAGGRFLAFNIFRYGMQCWHKFWAITLHMYPSVWARLSTESSHTHLKCTCQMAANVLHSL